MPPTVQNLAELAPAAHRFVRYLARRTEPTYLIDAPRGRYGVVEQRGDALLRADHTLNGATLRTLFLAGLITYGGRQPLDAVIGRRYRESTSGETVALADAGWDLVGGRPATTESST
jgi:hypothetical protein